MNQLELQLRSWVPRRPSPALKRRIFTAPPKPAPEEPATRPPHLRFAWLAPATAALLFVGLIFNQHCRPALSGSRYSSVVTLALSNQSAAAWLPGSFAADQNSLPAETFEWTNGSGSTSSIPSLSGPRGTN